MYANWSKGLKAALLIAALGLSGCNMFGGDDDKDNRDRQRTGEHRPGATPKAGSSQLNKADAEFMQNAASSGMYEVMSSELVSARGSGDAEVRRFAERMIADHRKANQEQEALAATKALPLPETMLPRHQQMYNSLSKLNGKQFDTAYINQQVQAHNEAVALFERASRDATDRDVKEWATRTLPVLRQHLEHVQGMRK